MRRVRVAEALLACPIGDGGTVRTGYGNESDITNERYDYRCSISDAQDKNHGDEGAGRHAFFLQVPEDFNRERDGETNRFRKIEEMQWTSFALEYFSWNKSVK